MAFELYVGNYPLTFSEEDVQSLFQKFHGVTFIRSIKKDKKCFSFLSCSDMDVLFHVVQTMNNTQVQGRKLVVRASKPEVQDYVNVLLDEKSAELETLERPYQFKEEKYSDECKNPSRFVHQCTGDEITLKRNDSPTKSSEGSSVANELSKSITLRRNDSLTKSSGGSSTANEFSKSHWVSVTNFPIGTSKNDLYEFFADYDPLKVVMLCNELSRNRRGTLTEAQICFSNHVVCHKVVSNFHNTLFCGRTLAVKRLPFVDSPEEFECRYSDKYGSQELENDPVSSQRATDLHEDYNLDQLPWISVANFPIGTTVDDIYELLKDYNPLEIEMLCNRARKDRILTEALVCFENQDICNDIIMNFDNTNYFGRVLLVTDVEDQTIFNDLMNLKLGKL